MAAIDQIIAYLMAGYEDMGDGYKRRIEPQVRREAEELYRAVAEELAVKLIETRGAPPQYCSKGSQYTYNWFAKRHAAFLREAVPFVPQRRRCELKEAHTPHVWVSENDVPYECVTVTTNGSAAGDRDVPA